MENTTQQPYHDSPPSSRSPTPTRHTSPAASSDSSTTIKPLPALPLEASTYSDNEPYQDESPETPYRDEPPTPTNNQHRQHYADSQPPPHSSDENIPLAHFLLHPNLYPHEAPPSYSVAVRQTHSHRDTLIQYIPNNEHTHITQQLRRPVIIEIDEESGEVVSRTDDVRHSVEKVVAMFVVAAILLVLSGVLGWLAVGSGMFGR